MSKKSGWQKPAPLVVILLLFAGAVINYTDRSLLSVDMPYVRRGLALSNAQYGLAVQAFLLMYAVFYILGGRIADRLGYRRTFTLTIVFWSLASMAHAFVQGLRSLVFCQAMLGMGEGSYYPTAIRGAARLFPRASRAKAVGAIMAAISLGMLLTPPLVAFTTLHYGWRATFLLIGSLGFLLLPVWLWVHRHSSGADEPLVPSAEEGDPAAGAPLEQEATLGQVLKTRKYWCVLAARGCADAAWYFYLFWVPGYFQEARGLSLATVGHILWIPYFCAFLGPFAGAAASGAMIHRGLGVPRSRKIALLFSASLGVISASACFAPTTTLALTLVSLALFAQQSWSANMHTAITEISPAKHVAILYGMTGAAGTFIGAAAQIVLGHIIDLHGYKPAFIWAGGMYMLAVGLVLSAGVLEPIRRRVGEA